jgi:hypothetical protein
VKWYTHNKFIITSRAIDIVGNLEIPGSGSSFVYDDVPPKGLSISIEKGRKLTNIPFVKVKLKFEDTLMLARSQERSSVFEMSFSFDGSTWTPWEPFTDEKTIELSSGDGVKSIYFRVKDQAGNIANPVSDSVTLDTTSPQDLSVLINKGAYYTNFAVFSLDLNAADLTSGLNNMSFSIDGTTWSNWEPFRTEGSIKLPTNTLDGEKTVYFRVSDLAGNIADPISDKIILDTTPPDDVEIIIESDSEFTNSVNVQLMIRGTDSLSGVDKMSFSFDGTSWNDWEMFETTKEFTLGTGDGTKFVYVRLIDNAGNIASNYEKIILDTKPPILLTIQINNGAEITDSTGVTLSLFAIDELSGIYQMRFSTDSVTWSDWEWFSNSKAFELPTGDGEKIVYFMVMDEASNTAEPVYAEIILKTTPDIIDADTDGYPDTSDAFPNDPAAAIDSDDDGSPDIWNPDKSEADSTTNLHLDAFPMDPAASIDTDNDGYPDAWNTGKTEADSVTGLKLDEYPNDSERWKKSSAEVDSDWMFVLIIIVIAVVILVIIVIGSIVFRSGRQRLKGLKEPYSEDKLIDKLIEDILNDKLPDTANVTSAEIINRLNVSFKNGEISSEVYFEIKNLLER